MNALNLGDAHLFCPLLQGDDCGRDVDGAQALMETLDFSGNKRFGVDCLSAALIHVRGGHLLQVVDVVDEDAIELVHQRIDVARDCDIDEKHGPIAALVKKSLAVLGTKDGVRRAGGADDDVGAAGSVVELAVVDHLGDNSALKLRCHAAGALGGSIADQDGSGALLHKVARGDLAHLSGAYEENCTPFKRAKDFSRKIDCDGGDGDGIGSDSGFATRFFGGGKGALQKMLKLAGDGSRGARDGKGFFDLAENLRLANHHGIEAGGHAKEMADSFLVTILVEVRRKNRGVDAKLAR